MKKVKAQVIVENIERHKKEKKVKMADIEIILKDEKNKLLLKEKKYIPYDIVKDNERLKDYLETIYNNVKIEKVSVKVNTNFFPNV